MRHVAAGPGTVPMSLVRRDQDDIADSDGMLPAAVGDNPLAMRDDERLLGTVSMPYIPRAIEKRHRRHSLVRRVTLGDEVLCSHLADEDVTVGGLRLRDVLFDNSHGTSLRLHAPRMEGPRMKVAVLSDIHGFSIALDRVLADIATEPDIDRLVVAGDLCEGGPDPRGVLERLATVVAVVLQGNTDRDIADGHRASDRAGFTANQIGEDGLRYLRNLRFSERITPPGGASTDDDLLVVHANPLDLDRHIPPDASPRELDELLGDTRAAVLAFGHLHIAYVRETPRMTLIDVSATGNPKDGDLRSKWGVLAWDEDARRWSAELRYVDYPLEETEAQIRASGIPNPESVIRKLRKASYSS